MAAMAVHVGGCATWKVQEPAPEQVIAAQAPDRVQVTKTDGTQLEIWEPQVVADSLAGLTEPDDAVWAAGRSRPHMVPTTVPLGEIKHVAVRRTNWGGVALVGVVVVAAMVICVGVALERLSPILEGY
jgi:hypothetical protein